MTSVPSKDERQVTAEEVAQLIDSLRQRPVATTAAQMRRAAYALEVTEEAFQGLVFDNKALYEEIQLLQRTLAFWLPMVPPAAFPAAVRLADDSFKLAGYDGPSETGAEELGWIQLMCPHGMPWRQNICGPCAEGRPNQSDPKTLPLHIVDECICPTCGIRHGGAVADGEF